MSSHQEQTNTGSPDGTYIRILPNGDLYVGTEPPVGGFATDGEAVMEELPVGGFAGEAGMEEQPNPLSALPQNKIECFGHPMWDLSKTCVACGEREYGGAVTSNTRLFRKFNCNFIRACPKHHAMVSAHFAKPEFNEPIDNPYDSCYEIRRCPQCGKNFSAISDSSNSFCDKGCQGNWLDCRFG
jgi:hypothetical protein